MVYRLRRSRASLIKYKVQNIDLSDDDTLHIYNGIGGSFTRDFFQIISEDPLRIRISTCTIFPGKYEVFVQQVHHEYRHPNIGPNREVCPFRMRFLYHERDTKRDTFGSGTEKAKCRSCDWRTDLQFAPRRNAEECALEIERETRKNKTPISLITLA